MNFFLKAIDLFHRLVRLLHNSNMARKIGGIIHIGFFWSLAHPELVDIRVVPILMHFPWQRLNFEGRSSNSCSGNCISRKRTCGIVSIWISWAVIPHEPHATRWRSIYVVRGLMRELGTVVALSFVGFIRLKTFPGKNIEIFNLLKKNNSL